MSTSRMDDIIQQIRNKRNQEAIENQRTQDQSEGGDFNQQFSDIYNLIVQSVDGFNTKLQSENVKLEVIEGRDNNTSNRKSLQVVLNEDNNLNILESPSLLIEGYVNSGEIRIVEAGSPEPGHTLPVGNINKELLQAEIEDFLANSF